jgi:hypothetical protein
VKFTTSLTSIRRESARLAKNKVKSREDIQTLIFNQIERRYNPDSSPRQSLVIEGLVDFNDTSNSSSSYYGQSKSNESAIPAQKPVWIPDSEATSCAVCKTAFSPLKRKVRDTSLHL